MSITIRERIFSTYHRALQYTKKYGDEIELNVILTDQDYEKLCKEIQNSLPNSVKATVHVTSIGSKDGLSIDIKCSSFIEESCIEFHFPSGAPEEFMIITPKIEHMSELRKVMEDQKQQILNRKMSPCDETGNNELRILNDLLQKMGGKQYE